MVETAVCLFLILFVASAVVFFRIARRIYRHRPRGAGDSLLANLFSEHEPLRLQPARVDEDPRSRP